jgi:hypothetical protein
MDLVSVTEARTINTRSHQERIFARFLARTHPFRPTEPSTEFITVFVFRFTHRRQGNSMQKLSVASAYFDAFTILPGQGLYLSLICDH